MPQQPVFFPLGGGLDLITPNLAKKPGRAIAALNYAPTSAGYRRFRGYERFDGRMSPSDRTYWRVNFTGGGFTGEAQPVAGNHVFTSSTKHGYIVATVITSGTWAGGNAAGYFVFTSLVGADLNGNIKYSAGAVPIIASTSGTTKNYDFGAAQNAVYALAAVAVARSAIAAVPGSGPVRGVWFFNGDVLAFRDNAGATAGAMFKASTAGWVAVAVLTRVDFTTTTPGQVQTGSKYHENVSNASGGANKGTIQEITYTSHVGAVYTGFMLLSGYVAGAFTAGAQIIYLAGSATQFGTTTAAAVTPVISAGGRYRFVNHNFYGAENRAAMYAVNGTGLALVYNSAGFGNITTGMPVDTPVRVAVHRQSLFLGFPGGSSQFSIVGQPLVFNPVLGAGEIAIGNEIADYLPTQGALAILGAETISVLYGNDSSDYTLEVLNDQAGALPHTAQWMGQGIYMDNRGIRSLNTTAAFGNFSVGTLSKMAEPLLADLRRDGVDPVLTYTSRSQDQYWVFFDNKTGLILYTGKKEPELLPFKLPVQVTCGCSVEDDGVERIFIGCDDGFVYEINKGRDFDGAALEHYVRLAFNSFGAPRNFKRIFKAGVELQASSLITLSVSADLDLGGVPGVEAQPLVVTLGGGAIDSLGSNELYYAAQIEGVAEAYLGATGKSLSLKFGASTIDEEPHTLTGVICHVSARGVER